MRVARSTGYTDDYIERRGEQAQQEIDTIVAEWEEAIRNGNLSEVENSVFINRLNGVNQRMVDDFIARFKSQTEANQ